MAEFHQLPSRYDITDPAWEALNKKAEELARKEPIASVPSLDHLTYKDFEFVYEPAADTFLLLDALQYELVEKAIFGGRKDPAIALEIGCGTGVVSVFLRNIWSENNNRSHLHSFVTDINPRALQVAKQTARISGISRDTERLHHSFFETVRCDLASALLPRLTGSITVLLFNPPYVPTPDAEVGSTGIEAAWAGGEHGRRVIDRVIESVARLLEYPDGVAYFVTVDDNKPSELAARFRRLGLDMRPLFRRRAHNEFLTIQKIAWISKPNLK
jgi:release factor glutamine methyltransferase